MFATMFHPEFHFSSKLLELLTKGQYRHSQKVKNTHARAYKSEYLKFVPAFHSGLL